jgi:hypothetical protein
MTPALCREFRRQLLISRNRKSKVVLHIDGNGVYQDLTELLVSLTQNELAEP